MDVPQGSILSVTLFGLKINSIIKAISPGGVDCSLYVDDFLICYRSKLIHIIERHASTNYLTGLTPMDLNSLSPKQSAYISVDYVSYTQTFSFSSMVHQFPLWRKLNSLASSSALNYPSFLTYGYYYYYYYLRWRMPPSMRQCWGLQVGPMHETAGMGKLINAALLSLMRCVWVYAVLPSSRVNSSAPLVCRHDQVTREVGRVGLVGRDRGRRGYWVALYLYIYTARLLMSVFL